MNCAYERRIYHLPPPFTVDDYSGVLATTLSNKKISLLESALESSVGNATPADEISNLNKKIVEVSLSSSGMGFFSDSLADDDAKIEVALTLNTLDLSVNFVATVLECRLSADAENPGYWIRVRFDRNQDQQIDRLLGHVTQRQIEKLERSTKSPSSSQTGNTN